MTTWRLHSRRKREMKDSVWRRDGYVCFYCGVSVTPAPRGRATRPTATTATIDHVVPVSKGGKHEFGNMLTSCWSCNSEKGDRPAVEYLLERFSLPSEAEACP